MLWVRCLWGGNVRGHWQFWWVGHFWGISWCSVVFWWLLVMFQPDHFWMLLHWPDCQAHPLHVMWVIVVLLLHWHRVGSALHESFLTYCNYWWILGPRMTSIWAKGVLHWGVISKIFRLGWRSLWQWHVWCTCDSWFWGQWGCMNQLQRKVSYLVF